MNIIKYFFIIFVLFSTACNTAKKMYYQAQCSQSIDLYEKFIKEKPKSKFIPEAKKELNTLYENRDWQITMKTNTLKAYNDFLHKYPDSQYSIIAKNKIAEIEEQRLWNNTIKQNNISAYDNFIKTYPNSKHVEVAINYKNELIEKKDWENAKKTNTIFSYQKFIEKHPNSKRTITAKELIKKIEDDRAWNEVVRINTIEAYSKYIEDFPRGIHFYSALTKVNEIKNIFPEWKKTLNSGTKKDYEIFLIKYPNSSYAEIARQKLNNIELSLWENAKLDNTIKSFRNYLTEYPNGRFAEDAKTNIKLIKNRKDEQAWQTAQNINTVKAYQKYQKDYPNGKYYDIAEKYIIDIQVNKIFNGKHGYLPPMQHTSYNNYYNTGVSEIKIFNNTSYTLTILYSGQESKRFVFAPMETKTYTLKNGSYRIAASVNARNVSSYAGTENLNGGSYSSEFYIVTTSY